MKSLDTLLKFSFSFLCSITIPIKNIREIKKIAFNLTDNTKPVSKPSFKFKL